MCCNPSVDIHSVPPPPQPAMKFRHHTAHWSLIHVSCWLQKQTLYKAIVSISGETIITKTTAEVGQVWMAHYSGSNSCAVFTNLKLSNAAFFYSSEEKKTTHFLKQSGIVSIDSIASWHLPSLSLYFFMLIINAKIFSRLIGGVENTELFQMKQSQWCSAEMLFPNATLSLAPCAKVPLSVPNVRAQKTRGRAGCERRPGHFLGGRVQLWGRASISAFVSRRLFIAIQRKQNTEAWVTSASPVSATHRQTSLHTHPHPHTAPRQLPLPELRLHSPLCSIPPRGAAAVKWSRGKKALCLACTTALFSLSVDNPLWTCQPTQEY